MCYSDPAKSLEIARSRLTPEQWAKFERDFKVFCDIHGLPDKWAYWPTYDWAKWSHLKGWQAGMHEAAIIASIHSQYPVTTDFDRGYAKARSDAAKSIRERAGIQSRDRRPSEAKMELIAIAMMDDEQAEASLERWRGVKGEAE